MPPTQLSLPGIPHDVPPTPGPPEPSHVNIRVSVETRMRIKRLAAKLDTNFGEAVDIAVLAYTRGDSPAQVAPEVVQVAPEVPPSHGAIVPWVELLYPPPKSKTKMQDAWERWAADPKGWKGDPPKEQKQTPDDILRKAGLVI